MTETSIKAAQKAYEGAIAQAIHFGLLLVVVFSLISIAGCLNITKDHPDELQESQIKSIATYPVVRIEGSVIYYLDERNTLQQISFFERDEFYILKSDTTYLKKTEYGFDGLFWRWELYLNFNVTQL